MEEDQVAKKKPVQPAPTPDFDAQVALTGYDERYLACRDLRHTWTVRGYFSSNGSIQRVLSCSRCATERIDTWGRSGERLTTAYHHPKGYLVSGGHIRPFEVRRETLSRVTVYSSEADMIASTTFGKSRR
jgi:hypothetical protein